MYRRRNSAFFLARALHFYFPLGRRQDRRRCTGMAAFGLGADAWTLCISGHRLRSLMAWKSVLLRDFREDVNICYAGVWSLNVQYYAYYYRNCKIVPQCEIMQLGNKEMRARV